MMLQKLKQTYTKSSANRAAINAIIIYLQRFFAAALSLITTPLILKALGVENYGLYTLTIGFVGTLAFLNWSMSSATQRYISFALGENDLVKVSRVFSTSLFIHFIYGAVLLVLLLVSGPFIAEHFLTIPTAKLADAKVLIAIVAGITFLSIVSVPFLGILRAHENFFYIALIGIFEAVFKLGIAFYLYFFAHDALITYGFLLLLISFITVLFYFYLVKSKYPKITLHVHNVYKSILHDMLSFISWSLLGALSIMSRNQGVQVLLNLFFGVVINAAYGIAMQVNAAMTILSQGVIGSLSPQIVKSAGSGDTQKMVFLMRTMSKFAIFSVSIVAIPLFFECDTILKIWLGKVPENTVLFVQLIILFGQLMLLSAGIQTVFDAIGKVKTYNIWVSLILILNLPLAYLLFKLNFPFYTIILVGMFLELVSLQLRLYLLSKYVNFSIVSFYKDTFRVFLPAILVSIVLFLVTNLEIVDYIGLPLTFLIHFILYPLLIYYLSLEKNQKEMFLHWFTKFKSRYFQK
jgi:O-antigen/teichoic acid export membrane protein